MVDESRPESNGKPRYRPGLIDAHLADLRKSGLSDEQIKRCEFYSAVGADNVSKILNWEHPATKLGACLAIPYFDADGKPIDYTRLKPNCPRVDKKKGTPVKYESPVGSTNRAFFPPGTLAALKDPSAPLLITEGEKKAAKADQDGFPCIGLVGVYGWQKARAKGENGKARGPRELIDDLAAVPWQGRHVYIVFDSDAADNKNVKRAEYQLAEVLGFHRATVKVIRLPAGEAGPDGRPAKVGLDDYLVAHGPDEFRKLIESAEQPAAAGPRADGMPTIKLTTEEGRVNDEVIKALAERGENVYQRGGMLVRVVQDGNDLPGISRPSAPRIEPIPRESLRELLTRHVWFTEDVFVKGIGEIEKAAHPAPWCVNAIHARVTWPWIRHLEAVVEDPVLLADGSILQTPGYHADSGILLVPRGELPKVPESPSKQDAIDAGLRLLDVVDEFPWRGMVDRSAFLAALLTPLARFAFEGPSPLFLCDANTRGAGKGLLLDVIALIATGERHTVMTWPKDEDELRKRITALVIGGDRLVLFDNLTGHFGNGTLDAALTSTVWRDRILGVNRTFAGPMLMTWYATGNNIQVAGDTARRICHTRFNSPEERPEDRRGFKNPALLAHVREHRPELLVDALTILRAYFVAGRPAQSLMPWGSFEEWSGIVREAIVSMGADDPIKTRQLLQDEADVPALAMKKFLQQLRATDPGGQGKTTHELIELARSGTYDDLRDAIETLAGKADAGKLGYQLRKYRRRVFGTLFLDKAGEEHRAVRWTARDATEFFHG